jgi:hypothetical protein
MTRRRKPIHADGRTAFAPPDSRRWPEHWVAMRCPQACSAAWRTRRRSTGSTSCTSRPTAPGQTSRLQKDGQVSFPCHFLFKGCRMKRTNRHAPASKHILMHQNPTRWRGVNLQANSRSARSLQAVAVLTSQLMASPPTAAKPVSQTQRSTSNDPSTPACLGLVLAA